MGSVIRGSDNFDSQKIVLGSAKAWVHFNGVTMAIGDSFNVSSVTDNGIGLFAINLTNAMQNTNFVWIATATGDTAVSRDIRGRDGAVSDTVSTIHLNVVSGADGTSEVDGTRTMFALFGN